MYTHGLIRLVKVDLLVAARLDHWKDLNNYVRASYNVTLDLVFCTFGIVVVEKVSSAGVGTQLSQLTL